MTNRNFRAAVVAAIEKHNEPQTLLGIANTLHGSVARVEVALAYLCSRGRVVRVEVEHTDADGDAYVAFVYAVAGGR